jgi:F-type H+-transporting ATPase subunit b
MEINATLLGQLITFIVLVGFTMKFVWPPIIKAIQDRQARIADGLSAAERGVHELELAQHKSLEILKDAKIQAADVLEQANRRAGRIIDEAKERAREEGEKLIEIAQGEIAQETLSAKLALRDDIAHIVVKGAEKIIQQKIDPKANEHLFHQLLNEI